MTSMALPSANELFPPDLSVLSNAELLELCNRYYKQLDNKRPVRDAIARYYLLAAELEAREAAD